MIFAQLKLVSLRVLILYTELATYFTACLKAFVAKYPDCEIHLIRYPVNKEAPFEFTDIPNVTTYERFSFDRIGIYELTLKIKPAAILSSGWIDKDYLWVCRKYKKKIPVIISFDNHWKSSVKQHTLKFFSKLYLGNIFNKVWIPGKPQMVYALKLGFKKEQIETGYYCGDMTHFNKLFSELHDKKVDAFPKRMICVARYIPNKNWESLWKAFIAVKAKGLLKDWELYCLGTGQDFDKRIEADGITHFGFVQPEQMHEYIAKTSVFILPSVMEPWGVVVQEFAAAGFPLLLSENIGSSTQFLEDGVNGYSFSPLDQASIENCMIKIAEAGPEEIWKMGCHSHNLANELNPDIWSDKFYKLITT